MKHIKMRVFTNHRCLFRIYFNNTEFWVENRRFQPDTQTIIHLQTSWYKLSELIIARQPIHCYNFWLIIFGLDQLYLVPIVQNKLRLRLLFLQFMRILCVQRSFSPIFISATASVVECSMMTKIRLGTSTMYFYFH